MLVWSTQPVSAEGRSQIFTVNIDGCEVLIQFVPESFEGIGTRIFFQSTSLIASISVPSDPDRCPPGSPIRAIAEASGLEKGDYFEIETLSLRGPATQDGTKIIFEFAVSEDPTDPDSLTRTFDLVLARPTG